MFISLVGICVTGNALTLASKPKLSLGGGNVGVSRIPHISVSQMTTKSAKVLSYSSLTTHILLMRPWPTLSGIARLIFRVHKSLRYNKKLGKSQLLCFPRAVFQTWSTGNLHSI